ncbi:MAG: response regulator, partial [Pseudomonadota bacterium]
MQGPDPSEILQNEALGDDDAREFRRLIALVVDDSTSLRKMLKLMLKKWNFDVLEASDGDEALEICVTREVDFVISDWMMPNMTGPELCRAVRKLDLPNYIYFILLTSKSDKNEVAAGLDAGADDFVVKPTDMGELHARLRAGQRLVRMQDDLVDKNRRITDAFQRLNTLYEGIDRDLKSAARLQKALIPE